MMMIYVRGAVPRGSPYSVASGGPEPITLRPTPHLRRHRASVTIWATPARSSGRHAHKGVWWGAISRLDAKRSSAYRPTMQSGLSCDALLRLGAEDLIQGNAQSIRKSCQHRQARVALLPLEHPDVGPMASGKVG